MSTRPVSGPQRFDTNKTNASAPVGSKITDGYPHAAPLPSTDINWVFNDHGEWLKYFADGDVSLGDVGVTGLSIGTAAGVAIANASQNNLVLNSTFVGHSFFNLTGGGTSAVITGFNVEDAAEGRLIMVMNETGNPVQISISDSASSSSNRIVWQNAPGSALVTVPWKGCFLARYHNFGIVSNWEVLACNFSTDFSTKTTNISPIAAKEFGGSGHTLSITKWTTGTSSDPIAYPLPVTVGRTITGCKAYINKTSSGAQNISLDFFRVASTTGTATNIGATSTAAVSPGFIQLTVSGLTEVVAAGYDYYIRVTPNNAIAGDEFYAVSFDHFGQ